ncbi:hypothetical protein AB0945_38710 [Streptomyces sp. NPDC005474]|uniref:hypothetical protein n=1 Tax=Streptomyces sp. NPDC005474 TaxID=3154878 RepID=UPI003451F844
MRFDWADRTTWEPALRGVNGMYLVAPELGSAQAADDIAAFARQAAAAGARRAVLVSFPGTGTPGLEHAVAAARSLGEAGLEAAVLRLRWSQNFSEDFLRDAVLSGDVRLPAGEGAEAFVDAEDIAAVAVTTLTETGHAGQTYELSGPQAMSFADAVAQIARTAGRPATTCGTPRCPPRSTPPSNARTACPRNGSSWLSTCTPRPDPHRRSGLGHR